MVIREVKKMDALLQKLLPPQKLRPDVLYRPSQFALQVGHRVWNTLTQECLETELPQAAYAGQGCDELIRRYFLVPEGKDECGFYESISSLTRAYHHKAGYRGYIILPTLGCNARCVYCYEQGMRQIGMTPEIVEQTIRFILDTHAEETIHIGWFGGEPLLRPDVIDTICTAMEEAGLSCETSMISNGSLITPEILAKMTGPWKLHRIQLSMDGAEEDYIQRKRYDSYQDQYHRVLESADQLAQAGVHVIIRCNVDLNNWDRIDLSLEDLKACIHHKALVGIYFCPLNEVRTSEEDIALWTRIAELRSRYEESGFRMSESICGNGRFRVFHCMADMNRVLISPDGGLYPCEHCPPEARYGDIWHNVTRPDVKDAFSRTDRTREKCRKCPYLPVCTSFAACPVQDTHCREIRDLDLRRFVMAMSDAEAPQNDITIC